MGLIDIEKYEVDVEVGGETLTFTELSIADHIQIHRKFESFTGDILDFAKESEIQSLEAIPFVLSLMLQKNHPDITYEDMLQIPVRILPDIFRDVIMGMFGSEDETDKKKDEVEENNQTGNGSSA